MPPGMLSLLTRLNATVWVACPTLASRASRGVAVLLADGMYLSAWPVVGAVALSLMGYTKSTVSLFVVVFVVGASTLGTQLLAYAYAGDFYPHAIRSTGVGFASGVGRIGAIVAPVLIGWLVSLKLPLEQNFMAIGVAGVIGAFAVMLINHRLSASVLHAQAAKQFSSAGVGQSSHA